MTEPVGPTGRGPVVRGEVEDLAPFHCLDCDVNTMFIHEYYMVTPEVWYSVVPPATDHPPHLNGMLCLGCLEARLGRMLTPADFPSMPVNDGYFPRSDRFLNRLGL